MICPARPAICNPRPTIAPGCQNTTESRPKKCQPMITRWPFQHEANLLQILSPIYRSYPPVRIDERLRFPARSLWSEELREIPRIRDPFPRVQSPPPETRLARDQAAPHILEFYACSPATGLFLYCWMIRQWLTNDEYFA